nr:hypothetical protein [Tanacetum cinerariifolium]
MLHQSDAECRHELVDLIKPHDHLNSIFVPKCDGSWKVDYRKVVLVFKASGISLRFSEVELSLAAFIFEIDNVGGPPHGSGLLTLCLMIDSSTLSNQSINIAMSLVYASSESSGGGVQVDTRADARLFIRIGRSDDGMDQAGSGVAGLSSSSGFHQFCCKFTLGIWTFPLSSSSGEYTYASGAMSLSICGGGGGGTCDDPEAPRDLEVPDGPAGGGGGGG